MLRPRIAWGLRTERPHAMWQPFLRTYGERCFGINQRVFGFSKCARMTDGRYDVAAPARLGRSSTREVPWRTANVGSKHVRHSPREINLYLPWWVGYERPSSRQVRQPEIGKRMMNIIWDGTSAVEGAGTAQKYALAHVQAA